MDTELYAKVRLAGRYCRDVPTRKKIILFLDAIRADNVRAACRRHGVVPKTYYFWWNLFVQSGFQLESLLPRSRRPRRSPRKIKGHKLKLVRQYRVDYHYGPERIQLYLKLNHGIHIAQSTIGSMIIREGLRLRQNRRPPKQKHTKRYSLPWPGDRLQMDIKYVPYKIQGEQYYVFNAIDDCTRWRTSGLYRRKGIAEAVHFLRHVAQTAPFNIRSIQLDNDSAFTYRLTPQCAGFIHDFETAAQELDIRLKFIPPGEKELQGKVERLHRTDDDEFFWKVSPRSFEALAFALDRWSYEYNHYRHHKELGWKTPAQQLQDKTIALFALVTYIANRCKPVPWPPINPWGTITSSISRRYLLFLDWCDSHPLPVTDVSGYHTSKELTKLLNGQANSIEDVVQGFAAYDFICMSADHDDLSVALSHIELVGALAMTIQHKPHFLENFDDLLCSNGGETFTHLRQPLPVSRQV
jgi:transposase InsO family protein